MPTSFTSFHISFAVTPCEFPDIKKEGHFETRTPGVSCAAIAKVTGGSSFAVLYCKQDKKILTHAINLQINPTKSRNNMPFQGKELTCDIEVHNAHHRPS